MNENGSKNRSLKKFNDCETVYPNCGSPHACDICYQLRDAEDDIEELINRVINHVKLHTACKEYQQTELLIKELIKKWNVEAEE